METEKSWPECHEPVADAAGVRADPWGEPCTPRLVTVQIGEASVGVDHRTVDAWRAFARIVAAHGYRVRPAFPKGDSGTYNCRRISGTPFWSRHAYAIAADLNWNTNPFGNPLRTDMPPEMIADIEALRTGDGQKVFRWGGRWATADAMHWEIACSPQSLATGISEDADVKNTERVQRELADHHGYTGAIDGDWGPQTAAAWRRQQRYNDRRRTGSGLSVDRVFRRIATDVGHDPGQQVDRADADRVVALAAKRLGKPFPGVPGSSPDPADNALVAIANMLGYDPGQRCGERCLETVLDRWSA